MALKHLVERLERLVKAAAPAPEPWEVRAREGVPPELRAAAEERLRAWGEELEARDAAVAETAPWLVPSRQEYLTGPPQHPDGMA
jgi:hypothetical protein